MRKGQDRKVKIAGRASCLGLIALCSALISPVSAPAYAEEVEDYGIDAQALTASTVGISFSPVAGTATAPVGVPTKFQVTATVDVENSGGYTVYFGSNSQNLTRVGGTETIAPITGSVDFDNLENDTWGYALAEGTTVPDTTAYTAVPGSVRGRAVYTNNSTKIVKESRTYTLSFAARIGTSKPAGTYTNAVTMSVVSSPAQLALGDITEMQQMTSDICENTVPNASKQLKDVRDGKYYWVSKLADGKCWMTQNLDLDLNADTLPLTAATSDVESDWTPMKDGAVLYTAMIADENTIVPSDIGQGSWSLGDYRIIHPDDASNCGSDKNSAADCPEQFVAFTTPTVANNETDAHYILGNHYQWNAATAGTGGLITSDQATNSVCPKGWRLPTSGDGGEFAALVTTLGGTSSVDNITRAPFYGVNGGHIEQDTDRLFVSAGIEGHYWSSSPTSTNDNAYSFSFGYLTVVYPFASYTGRQEGFSIRCLAQ